jgi:DNA topoisomerase I
MNKLLRYVDSSEPGISRLKSGKGWKYLDIRGREIKRRSEIERLNAIALPPAYRNAWFCIHANGHIQAVGWDTKARKQYRYHTEFRVAKENDKYSRCAEFGKALSKIRKKVDRDLSHRKVIRDTVVAAVVRLLDRGRVRIGNESYARNNKSFGATTLRRRHVVVKAQSVYFDYIGKSGKVQSLKIEDKRLARVVRHCLDEPGAHLFEYVDNVGERRAVTSSDVNAYLREASGGDFTAKHFRTWGASVLALDVILKSQEQISMKSMLQPVAQALGNTPAIARKSYIHPSVIALLDVPKKAQKLRSPIPRPAKLLSGTERALLLLLKA